MLSKFKPPISPEELSAAMSASLSSVSPAILLALFLGALLIIETHSPFEKYASKHLFRSYKANIGMFMFNSVVMSLLSVTSLLILAEHYSGHGLLSYVPSAAGKAVLAFLLLDFLLYVWHKVCHSFDCLWMFHRVHHNDPTVNVTTSFRVHIMELLLTSVLKGVYIIALGVDVSVVLAYELAITFFVVFHHGNIAIKGERFLSALFIVPSLHRTHHSVLRSEHDNNYGAVFSVWDRVFGTLLVAKPKKLGVSGESPEDLIGLIMFGFVTPAPAATHALPVYIDLMVKEAAYYKAEKRGFSPGYEMNDWLEARKEILRMYCGDKTAKRHSKPWLSLVTRSNLNNNLNQGA